MLPTVIVRAQATKPATKEKATTHIMTSSVVRYYGTAQAQRRTRARVSIC